MNTMEVGRRLVELCNARKYREAIDELYADDCTHVEPAEMPPMPQVMTGKAQLAEASERWMSMNDIHDARTTGPYPHGERFMCMMSMDLTPKEGPMAGQRMQIEEAVLYTVRDGRIAKVEFFYPTGMCEE